VALGAVAVLAFRQELAVHFFKVQPGSLSTAAWVISCAAVGAIFFTLAQCGQSTLQGLQRYDLSSVLALSQTALFLGGVALLLWSGHGIHAIGELFVAAYAVLCLVVLAVAWRLSPASPILHFWRQGPSQPLRAFFAFSASSFIAQLAWSVACDWDKIFIGHMLPLSQLTYYLIPSAIMQKFWLIPAAITTTAYPMLSELHGAGDRAAVKRFYSKCSQVVLWLVMPGFVMIMVLAPQFLTLWLGEEFSRYGTWPLRLLAMGYFINFIGVMPRLATGGLGRIEYGVKANIALAVSCLVFWKFLIPRLGIVGAAWGFFLSFLIVQLPLIHIVNRDFFDMGWLEYLGTVCLRPLSAGAALLLVVWAAHFWLYTWVSFFLVGGLCLGVYLSLGFLLLDRDSYESLRGVVAALRSRLALK
jgi:O-antigen/teichoic acid export membrane protein